MAGGVSSFGELHVMLARSRIASGFACGLLHTVADSNAVPVDGARQEEHEAGENPLVQGA